MELLGPSASRCQSGGSRPDLIADAVNLWNAEATMDTLELEHFNSQ